MRKTEIKGMNRVVALFLATSLVLAGCGKIPPVSEKVTDDINPTEAVDDTKEEINENPVKEESSIERKSFISEDEILYNEKLVPSVEEFEVADDLSNVINVDDFSHFMPEEFWDALKKDGFVIDATYGNNEFFDEYEGNRYSLIPNFVTVDSLMHTYHLYFGYLLKSTEKKYLCEKLTSLTKKMFDESLAQYEKLKGTDFENAAIKNVVFFSVPASLLGIKTDIPDFASKSADNEVNKINSSAGIDISEINGLYEDYSQYKVRGYYEGDEQLEGYFKAMMWYGRTGFQTDDEDCVKSTILITEGMKKCFEDWEKIYLVTSFFAGASDDLTPYEYTACLDSAYGEISDISEILNNKDAYDSFVREIENMPAPRINSIPVWDTDENVIKSFRFMGQRFSVDEAVFTNLTYRNVEENANGDRRNLPDTLDIMAALGSEKAKDLIHDMSIDDYPNYYDNLKKVQDEFNNSEEDTWNASLYSKWIDTLRPLLLEKGKGYPKYQQNPKWTLKNLETFAGSYAELKHDTILYSKQTMAEMGGGDIEEKDDRGYVDPQPVVYSKFANLAAKTKEGLEAFGMIDEEQKDNLDILYEMALKLIKISEKELVNETLTDEEYEFIRCYGGDLEHFWLEVNKESEYGLTYSEQSPCPIIADIATDPNGAVLEVGTGTAHTIYVVVNVDGKIKIARGSAYSFYQLTTDIGNRLTDSEWRRKVSGYLDDNYEWHEKDESTVQPEWTQSYRLYRTFNW